MLSHSEIDILVNIVHVLVSLVCSSVARHGRVTGDAPARSIADGHYSWASIGSLTLSVSLPMTIVVQPICSNNVILRVTNASLNKHGWSVYIF